MNLLQSRVEIVLSEFICGWICLMFKDRLQDNDDNSNQEHKNGDAVDAMHIFDPSAP